MGKMEKENEYLFELDYDKPYQKQCIKTENHIHLDGRRTESLNGDWNFTIDVYDTFYRKKFFEEKIHDEEGNEIPFDFSFDEWETIPVPSVWNLKAPEYFYYEGSTIYTRTFQVNSKMQNERIFLSIGAANYETRIWLNGSYVARHMGGFTPFAVDITDYLKENNRILITVNNERKLEQLPSINYDWFNYGGIYRDVNLVYVSKIHIKDFFVSLVNDGEYNKIHLQASISEQNRVYSCQIQIEELGINTTAYTDKQGKIDIIIPANPILWELENPKLYEVKISCGDDSITDMIGFRDIQAKGKQILLNGKEIFLKGVCCHEESLENGRALSEKDRKKIIHTAKEMGCNMMRLAHYPHSEEMSKLADREGILLWEELPIYWVLCFDNTDTQQDARNQLKELVLRDRNRASVIIWGVGNENPDTDERLNFTRMLIDECKSCDQSRLISAACLINLDTEKIEDRLCDYLDVISINEYYGWYQRDYNQLRNILNGTNLDKPLLISETGASAAVSKFGGDEELFTENKQETMFKKQVEIIDGHVQGFFPWLLFDSRSPVRMNCYQKKFNIKGLVAADKEYRKKAFYILKKYYKNK